MARFHKAPEQVHSPLGYFPSSNPARVLFDDADDNASTQGNSRGEINSPKVISVVNYQCGVCENQFNRNEDARNHMKEIHKKTASPASTPPAAATPTSTPTVASPTAATPTAASPRQLIEEELEEEMDVLEAAATEEQDIYDALHQLTQTAIDPDTESETRASMEGKLMRYKSIMLKKNDIISCTQEKVKHLEKTNEALKHNSKLSEEVVDRQKINLDESNNKVKKLETEIKKAKDQFKISIETMQKTVGEIMQNNSDLKIEVSNQAAYIKSLESANEPDTPEDDTDTVQVHREEVTERVDMSKDSTEHRCQACDKKFNASADLDRHMNDKHTESECHMCEKKFSSRKECKDHICMEGELIAQQCDKSYCKKEFISRSALKDHMKSSHFGNQRSVCPKCGEIGDNKWNIKKHMEICPRGGKGKS